MRSMSCAIGATIGLSVLSAPLKADFVQPDQYGWTRQSPNTTYFEWNVFSSPSGGNAPDVGQFPIELPKGWTTPDVVETTGAAFVTSGGNIYSFSGPTDFDVTFPSYGNGKPWTTLVIVQIRTLGSELQYDSVRIDGVLPVEQIELAREALGGFGGAQVDTLFRFELPGDAPSHVLEFNASSSSMSLDQLSIDALVSGDAPCRADFNDDGVANSQDFFDFLTAFFGSNSSADFNDDGAVNSQDFFDFLTTFFAGC